MKSAAPVTKVSLPDRITRRDEADSLLLGERAPETTSWRRARGEDPELWRVRQQFLASGAVHRLDQRVLGLRE